MTLRTSSQAVDKLLAVDTSTAIGSLALFDKDLKFIEEVAWAKKAMHSEVATFELQNLLQKTSVSLPDITHFAVNVGPGSFTGLRVGINLVRTLAYAFERPVAMFSSLEVLAARLPGEKITVCIPAIQNFFYAATYQRDGKILKPLVEPHSSTDDEGLQEASTSARELGALCEGASFFSWKDVKPLYVRASEAEEKLKKGLLKPL